MLRNILFILLFFSYLQANSQSVLADGKWAKVSINENGLYKITYDEIISMGLSGNYAPCIYSNATGELDLINTETPPQPLQQIPLIIEKGADNIFNSGDYVIFYGTSQDKWGFDNSTNLFYPKKHSYSNNNFYFINTDNPQQKEITSSTEVTSSPTQTITESEDFQFQENDESNLIESGREWYEFFSNKSISFSTPNIVVDKTATFTFSLAARDPNEGKIGISINNIGIDDVITAGTKDDSPYAVPAKITHSFLPKSNSNSTTLISKTSGINTRYYIDYISLQYKSKLKFSSDALLFRSIENISNENITNFSIESLSLINILDVTDPFSPKLIPSTFNNGKTSFKTKLDTIKEFVAFNSKFKTVTSLGIIDNQDLLSNLDFEMIIITPKIFREYAEELAATHKEFDNIKTKIVSQEEICNEFSGGKADISALRNYFRYVYINGGKLKYVLLFGDGSFDNRNFDLQSNHIVTFQTQESLNAYSSVVSDDYFGLLDPEEGSVNGILTGTLDIAIGRFPVNTEDEAKNVTYKTIQYITNPKYKGDWQNNLCFVADDADENQKMHMTDANLLTRQIDTANSEYNFKKIYLDSYKQVVTSSGEQYPEATNEINNSIKKGCLVLNYTGHGNEYQLTGENVLNATYLNSWKNKERLPLFITASCEVGRFDAEDLTSLGEKLFLQKDGGAVALFSTTRVVFSNANFELNKNIYRYLFNHNPETGKPLSIGEAFIKGKALTANGGYQNKRSFMLFGDPALCLGVPEYRIVIDSLNHISVNDKDLTKPDTILTLSSKSINTIHGHVEDYFGNKVSNYNGTLYMRIFDKAQTIETLGNEGGNNKMIYDSYNNELFHGKATIENGLFSNSFIIPQDIYYYDGTGKISLYCNNNTTQGSGAFKNFKINGSSQNAVIDEKGPSIEIYMNDTLFKEKQITHENPRLYIKVFDSSGINISNSAIGHNIVIELDDDANNSIVLNEFYISDENTFASGSIEYPFTSLSPGYHTITITVWDTYNNASTKSLEFYVTSQENISINDLYNYPNPVEGHTTFRFEHNQADKEITATIRIYNLQGALIKTLTHTDYAESFSNETFYWDGTGDNGSKIRKGIYPYSLTLTTEDGLEIIANQKLLVLQ